jgi:hypothetical protein
MSTQPEALRLIQVAPYLEGGERSQWIMDAAAEMTRLSQVNAELLEALKLCEGNIDSLLASAHPKVFGIWLNVVRAAIAKATGATHD